MTPAEFASARARLGLNLRQMAEALRLGRTSERTIRRYESGERRVPGPVALAVEAMLRKANSSNFGH